MLTGVFNDLATTLQYVTPVAVSVRYTKHPLASEPGLKRHTSPVGEEVLIETPITLKVPKTQTQPSICVTHHRSSSDFDLNSMPSR